MAKIGLIGMSGKPFHLGHARLVALASQECDEVHLYVSTSDRARKGEVVVLGSDMALLWKETLESSLPNNVRVTYGGSPIGNVWKELGEAGEGDNSYVIYGDCDDVPQAFPRERLEKYCGDLVSRNAIKLRAIERATTADVSGTLVRSYLAAGDKDSFIRCMPENIDVERVWNVLHKSARKALKKNYAAD